MSVFALRVGDCFNDRATEQSEDLIEVTEMEAIPCSDPHDNEVYAVLEIPLERYPGQEEMGDLAFEECAERFESFVGMSYAESILDIFFLTPTAESWAQGNDRQTSCAVFHVELEKLTGSMGGSGI